MPDIFALAQSHRRDLLKLEAPLVQRVRVGYAQIFERLLDEIAVADVPEVKSRLESLKRQLWDEMLGLNRRVRIALGKFQPDAQNLSVEHTQAIVRAAMSTSDARFNPGLVQRLLTLTAPTPDLLGQESNPLRKSFDRLARSLPQFTTGWFERTIIEGAALGQGIDQIKRKILERSLERGTADPEEVRRIRLAVHSSVMWSYREQTRDTYGKAGVEEWQWLSSRNARTCPACWALDGRIFKTEEPLRGHANCRCTMVPVLDAEGAREIVAGRDKAWNALDEQRRRNVLGIEGARAYDAGEVTLDDFVTEKTTDYGKQFVAAGAREAIDRAKSFNQ